MSLLIPGSDGGFVHSDAENLARKLRDGDGLTWSGDRQLELRVGILEETRYGHKTGRVARRYEVYRMYDDGREEKLGHWHMSEYDQILPSIVLMKAGAEGRATSVLDRIDAHNKVIEDKKEQEFRDAYGPVVEHALALQRESEHGRHDHFQVGGLRDEPKAPVESTDAD